MSGRAIAETAPEHRMGELLEIGDYNDQSSMTVRSVNSGAPSKISIIVARASVSPSWRRESLSRARAFSSLSKTTNMITRLGSFESRVAVECTSPEPRAARKSML